MTLAEAFKKRIGKLQSEKAKEINIEKTKNSY